MIGGKGPNREVLRRCLQGDLQPFVGNAPYLEYQDLLNRENIQAFCKQTSVSLMEFLDGFAQVCTAIDARYLWRPNLKDEADNHLVELAIMTLSIRLPDDMAERLKNNAKVRDISLNKLMFELSTHALAEEEAKQRFLVAQLRGNPKRSLQLLDELGTLGF